MLYSHTTCSKILIKLKEVCGLRTVIFGIPGFGLYLDNKFKKKTSKIKRIYLLWNDELYAVARRTIQPLDLSLRKNPDPNHIFNLKNLPDPKHISIFSTSALPG